MKIPSVKGKSLINLKIGRSELNTPQLQKLIKSAYRTQAKKHHPDLGGDTAAFRKIHQAYEELISWAESPTFIERRGFPDKWFYDGNKNRWVQPTPHTNIKEYVSSPN
ncbi:MAG: J domain-containing protein [Deltaproteobacteria bacterium]|nr:J domain-containing protein [Deltaproteobacteria bacterium]